jgi:hypothetical protein
MAVISTVLFMFQVSIDTLGEDAGTLYSYEGSIMQSYDAGGYNLKQDASEGIPELPSEVSTESTNSGFTDIFKSISSWFSNTKTGKIINSLYYAVPNALKGMGMPSEFSFALGVLWTLLAMFSFVMFMRGVL